MPRPQVLLLGEIDHANDYWRDHIDAVADTVKCKSQNRAEFLQQCKAGQYDDIIAVYRTFGSVSQTGLWDEELCSALPKKLHFVAHNGAGYDQLSIPALTFASVLATNTPSAVDDATADTALFLLIGALRNYNTAISALRRGDWRGKPPPSLGHDPQGKTLGILGMGGIGKNLADKARAFGMDIIYHNRRELSQGDSGGAKYLSFEDLLKTSDVLSVHVPLGPQTKYLLGAKELALCKKGVVIVNTARGAVIDEAALVEALDSGRVGSVGLDVYEEEPKVHEGLVKNEKCLLLPHMGTWTKETQTKMEELCIRNVEFAVRGASSWGKMTVVPEQKDMLQNWISKGGSGP